MLTFFIKYVAHHLPAGLGMKLRQYDYQRLPTRTEALIAATAGKAQPR